MTLLTNVSPPSTDLQLIKRGEEFFQGGLSRHAKGLRIRAKAHPAIEDLVRSWGTGEVHPLSAYGRYWLEHPEKLFGVYQLGPQMSGVFPFEGGLYTLEKPGSPLIGTDSGAINISFLRAAGISEGDGVVFYVKGLVMTPEGIRELGGKIHRAIARFYSNYLLPVELTISLSTQEVRL